MFRKIHSKKESGITLLGELRKEFGHHVRKAGSWLGALLSRYPFAIFAAMVLSILLSGILAFTVMRQKKPAPFPKAPTDGTGAVNSIPGMLNAYEAFKEAAYLQSRIEAIARKDSLTVTDSAEVVNALKRIGILRHQFKTR